MPAVLSPLAVAACAALGLTLGVPSQAGPPLSRSVVQPAIAVQAHAARWTWPVSGPLGERPSVERGFDPPAQRWDAGHRGIDLDASPGDPVVAVASGTVAFAGSVGGKPVVTVDHAGGVRSTVEPVTASVSVGQVVAAGEAIGKVAADGGHCAGSCLHLGAIRSEHGLGERYLNPLALLAPIVLKPLR